MYELIKKLQYALKDLGYLRKKPKIGEMDGLTLSAIKNYRLNHGCTIYQLDIDILQDNVTYNNIIKEACSLRYTELSVHPDLEESKEILKAKEMELEEKETEILRLMSNLSSVNTTKDSTQNPRTPLRKGNKFKLTRK